MLRFNKYISRLSIIAPIMITSTRMGEISICNMSPKIEASSIIEDSTAYYTSINEVHRSADIVANAADNTATRRNYVLNSVDLANMIDSTKDIYSTTSTQQIDTTKNIKKTSEVKKPARVMYNGLEVEALKEFSNAKLIGVANHNIEFYSGGLHTYYAKGLLFELTDSKLLNVIARNEPFYVGQRYDIAYHPFKKGIKVDATNIMDVFLSGENDAYISNEMINTMYDGVLAKNSLSRKDK